MSILLGMCFEMFCHSSLAERFVADIAYALHSNSLQFENKSMSFSVDQLSSQIIINLL